MGPEEVLCNTINVYTMYSYLFQCNLWPFFRVMVHWRKGRYPALSRAFRYRVNWCRESYNLPLEWSIWGKVIEAWPRSLSWWLQFVCGYLSSCWVYNQGGYTEQLVEPSHWFSVLWRTICVRRTKWKPLKLPPSIPLLSKNSKQKLYLTPVEMQRCRLQEVWVSSMVPPSQMDHGYDGLP